MASMRECQTAVVARNDLWSGAFATEPYEAGWAGELVIFVRLLAGSLEDATIRVQISPDGIHWCDEGSAVLAPIGVETLSFVRIRHFGQYIRLSGEVPGDGGKVLVAINAKS